MQRPKRFFLPAERVDVARWGIAALASGTLAVMAANLSFLVPAHTLSTLHAPYRDSGGFSQMRTRLAELEQERYRMQADYRALLSRFNLLYDDSDEVVRRLAAVEISLPLLIESLPLESDIDRSLLTGSTTRPMDEVYEVDGGEIAVRYRPLFGEMAMEEPAGQPMPPPLPVADVPLTAPQPAGDAALIGVAVGDSIPRNGMATAYVDIAATAGTLLLNTTPLVGEGEVDGEGRIIFGPLPDASVAQALCARLARLELACDQAPYQGDAWPL